MKYFNSILIVCLMCTLMGCPWLDSPPPLSPLPIDKSSNTAFKAATQQCRLINDGFSSYKYDASGNLIPQGTITYNQAGLIAQATLNGFTTVFTYDANNLIVSAKRTGATSSNLFKYTNGVFTSHEEIDNKSGKATLVSSGNALGQPTNFYTINFQYDSRGNVTVSDDVFTSIVTYEYDNKINPAFQANRFVKGQGSAFNPSINSVIQGSTFAGISPNNVVKRTYAPTGGGDFAPIITTFVYIYNAQGLPLTRSINGGAATTYQYENCQ